MSDISLEKLMEGVNGIKTTLEASGAKPKLLIVSKGLWPWLKKEMLCRTHCPHLLPAHNRGYTAQGLRIVIDPGFDKDTWEVV